MYKFFGKRLFDISLSSFGLILLSPVLLIVSFMVRKKLGSPVLFKQARPGKHEKMFDMYKFRTMTSEKDASGKLLPDEARLTKFGMLLRKTSLDELPELFNILKGDMSVVGPRPLLKEYLPRYNQEQRKRHLVRPGLTGLAQINGRNLLTWSEKFSYDVKYVENLTFIGDLKIILATIMKVIRRDGINSETAATMEPFLGNDDSMI